MPIKTNNIKREIEVNVDNIFPLFKKFLYSEHEIFLREFASYATDAAIKDATKSNQGSS